MIRKYQSVGISAQWDGDLFRVSLSFFDSGTATGQYSMASGGNLSMTHPAEDVRAAIVTLKEDAERLGVEFVNAGLYVECGPRQTMPPDWEAALQPVANLIGFTLIPDYETGGFLQTGE